MEKVTEGTGHVLRLGPGAKIDKLGLKVGDKVVLRSYLKYANALTCQLKWPDGRTKEHFLMSVDDILMVVDDKTDVGVFSGRPMNPVTEVDHG